MTDEEKLKEKDRESYLRWQQIAITQLGYTINLFLTFSGTTLGFALKILMDSQTPFSGPAHCLFHFSLPLLLLSIASALLANVTRALDFRYTRRAAKERMKDGKDHDDFHHKADCYGSWTWGLFYIQTASFAVGVVLFATSIWFAYANRI